MDLLLHRADKDGRLSYRLVPSPQTVRGISQLIQEVAVELLSDYDPIQERGSNLSRDLGEVVTGSASAQAVASRAVQATKGVILARQQRAVGLTGQERLSDLQLLSVEAGINGWTVSIELTPASGSPVTASLEAI